MKHVIEVIFLLQGLNFVADYPLQGDFLANFKNDYKFFLFVHCFIWTFVITCGLLYFNIYDIWKVLFLFIGHIITDKWKCTRKDKSKLLTKYLWIDQCIHFIQIIIVGAF